MNAVYEALGRFVVRYRWAVVVFWLAVVVLTSATMPNLSNEVNDNNGAFLSSSQPSMRAANLAAPLLGSGANGRITRITIVAYRTGALTTADVRRPGVTLGIGALVFLALAIGALGYKSSGFGGSASAPKGSDAAAGNAALQRYFPARSANPANLILSRSQPVWNDPGRLVAVEATLRGSGAFTQLSGPLDANGTQLTPTRYEALHAMLGPPQRLQLVKPPALAISAADYNAYRATAGFVSNAGTVVQFEAALAAGNQSSTAAINAIPQIRTVLSAAARASGAVDHGVAGEAAAVYDVNQVANHDLKVVVAVAIVAIGILLALVLRSLVAPLYVIVSVAISYLASLGVATVVSSTSAAIPASASGSGWLSAS